jgi:hypothetical protein
MTDSRADLSERESALARRRTAEHSHDNSVEARPQHPVLRLQRQVGNAQVARMLQRAGEEDELQMKRDPALQRAEDEELLQGKHDPALQRMEQEGDEEEAIQGKHDPALQRMESEAEEEEAIQGKHDPALQRKASVGMEGGSLDDQLSAQIDAKIGGGSSLDDNVRKTTESAMGTSFEGVRVHRDSDSDALNRSITAKAFTTGSDIFLRQDQSPSDTSLMAHELTHVVQQRSMPASGVQGKMVGAAGDSYEQEADHVAQQVVSGAAQRAQEDEHAHSH